MVVEFSLDGERREERREITQRLCKFVGKVEVFDRRRKIIDGVVKTAAKG